MDHDALAQRIDDLERQLELLSRARSEPRPGLLWPWWQSHGRRVLLAIGLVAIAGPTSVWLHARHEERMQIQALRHETYLAKTDFTLQHRHERILAYIDTALENESPERRAAALRYLAEGFPTRTFGNWAAAELEQMGASAHPRPRRHGCRHASP